jgi:histidinol phosphatase-like PHP family hydrolase
LYKYDLHVHTSETSHCGKVSASEMVDLYIREGYSGIVVTDHYSEGFFRKLGTLSWNEKVDSGIRGSDHNRDDLSTSGGEYC